MTETAELEGEVAELTVEVLNLEESAEDIDPEQPLFGDGLGLDSIDALELAVGEPPRTGAQPGDLVIDASPRAAVLHTSGSTGTPTAHGKRCAVALRLARGRGLALRFSARPAKASPMPDAGLEALRLANPAARALPLLAVLARGGGRVALDCPGGHLLLELGEGRWRPSTRHRSRG